MHIRTIVFMYILSIQICLANSSLAAEVSTFADRDDEIMIFLVGDIVEGDAERVAGEYAILNNFGLVRGRTINLYLNSNGGDVYEAMKIGRFVQTTNLSTVVDATMEENGSGKCLSSCFLIFIAGFERALKSNDALGTHRPYFDRIKFKNFTTTEARVFTKNLYQETQQYLLDQEVRQSMIDEMLMVPSTDIKMYNTDDFEKGFGRFKPSIYELVEARCQNFSVLSPEERYDYNITRAAQMFIGTLGYDRFENDYADNPIFSDTFGKYAKFSDGYKKYLSEKVNSRVSCLQNVVLDEQRIVGLSLRNAMNSTTK